MKKTIILLALATIVGTQAHAVQEAKESHGREVHTDTARTAKTVSEQQAYNVKVKTISQKIGNLVAQPDALAAKIATQIENYRKANDSATADLIEGRVSTIARSASAKEQALNSSALTLLGEYDRLAPNCQKVLTHYSKDASDTGGVWQLKQNDGETAEKNALKTAQVDETIYKEKCGE